MSDLATAAGAASIPGPFTNGSDDWFVYQPIVQLHRFSSGVGFDAQAATQYRIDSKAKRITHEGRAIAVMVENGHATAGFAINFNIRLLGMVRGTR